MLDIEIYDRLCALSMRDPYDLDDLDLFYEHAMLRHTPEPPFEPAFQRMKVAVAAWLVSKQERERNAVQDLITELHGTYYPHAGS